MSCWPAAAPTLITPHAGELARLLYADRADIEARRLDYARAAAAELGVTVLLKGSTTVMPSRTASQPVLVNSTGTPWLATAGSGDVLSGLAGSLLAQGVDAPQQRLRPPTCTGWPGGWPREMRRSAPVTCSPRSPPRSAR